MCMNNVNASILLTTNVEILDNGVRSLGAIFNGIVPKSNENGYYLPDFYVILNASVMFDLDENGFSDCDFKIDTKYDCIIRMTHVDSGRGINLQKFTLEISRDKLKKWCKSFYEFSRYIQVKQLSVPKGLGDYAIKLLIREKKDGDQGPWTTQTISSLVVGERY